LQVIKPIQISQIRICPLIGKQNGGRVPPASDLEGLKRAFTMGAGDLGLVKGLSFLRLLPHTYAETLRALHDRRQSHPALIQAVISDPAAALTLYLDATDGPLSGAGPAAASAFILADLGKLARFFGETHGVGELTIHLYADPPPSRAFASHSGLRLIYDTVPQDKGGGDGWAIFRLDGMRAKLSGHAVYADIDIRTPETSGGPGAGRETQGERTLDFMARLEAYKREQTKRADPGAGEISPQWLAKVMEIELLYADQDSKEAAEEIERDREEGQGFDPIPSEGAEAEGEKAEAPEPTESEKDEGGEGEKAEGEEAEVAEKGSEEKEEKEEKESEQEKPESPESPEGPEHEPLEKKAELVEAEEEKPEEKEEGPELAVEGEGAEEREKPENELENEEAPEPEGAEPEEKEAVDTLETEVLGAAEEKESPEPAEGPEGEKGEEAGAEKEDAGKSGAAEEGEQAKRESEKEETETPEAEAAEAEGPESQGAESEQPEAEAPETEPPEAGPEKDEPAEHEPVEAVEEEDPERPEPVEHEPAEHEAGGEHDKHAFEHAAENVEHTHVEHTAHDPHHDALHAPGHDVSHTLAHGSLDAAFREDASAETRHGSAAPHGIAATDAQREASIQASSPSLTQAYAALNSSFGGHYDPSFDPVRNIAHALIGAKEIAGGLSHDPLSSGDGPRAPNRNHSFEEMFLEMPALV
jgi:hypothetical protein